MNKCTFPDCEAPAVARGFCAKHYMRLHRHGDPAKVGRAGRPDGDAARRAMMSELSDRGYARYSRALRLLKFCGFDVVPVIKSCSRPNGSMNMSKFEEYAEGVAAMFIVQLECEATTTGRPPSKCSQEHLVPFIGTLK